MSVSQSEVWSVQNVLCRVKFLLVIGRMSDVVVVAVRQSRSDLLLGWMLQETNVGCFGFSCGQLFGIFWILILLQVCVVSTVAMRLARRTLPTRHPAIQEDYLHTDQAKLICSHNLKKIDVVTLYQLQPFTVFTRSVLKCHFPAVSQIASYGYLLRMVLLYL